MKNIRGAKLEILVFAFAAALSAASAAVAAPDAEHQEAVPAAAPAAETKTEGAAPAAASSAAGNPAAKAAAPARNPEDLYKDGQQAITQGNLIEAINFFRKSADAGYAPAQVAAGDLCLTSEFYVDSVKYFRMAADQGNADGQFGLANSYVEGKGIPKDLKLALEWFTKAAEQDHFPAIDALATAYANGGLGLSAEERNSDKAFHWIEAAAKHDSLLAMRALTYAYKTGAFGATPNPAQAEAWEAKVKAVEAKYQKKKKGKS